MTTLLGRFKGTVADRGDRSCIFGRTVKLLEYLQNVRAIGRTADSEMVKQHFPSPNDVIGELVIINL